MKTYPKGLKTHWSQAISHAKKRMKNWQKKAKEAWQTHEARQKTPFNILHANTEVLVPAIYNSEPVADVRTRFNDRNEIARKGAQILERALSYSFEEYDSHDTLLTCVRDLAITGRGIARVRYKPLMRTNAQEDQDGNLIEKEEIIWQSVSLDYVPWNQFYHQDARIWADVEWVAFEQYYSRAELRQITSKKIAEQIPLSYQEDQQDEQEIPEEENTEKKARIYEIWDKKTRKVYYLSEEYEEILATLEDPLTLLDFFPMPPPLYAGRQHEHLIPIVPFSVYEQQARELNNISQRILSLIQMLKFRGIRASEIPELESLETLEDGEFISSQSAMVLLQQGGGLDRAIWTMPLERIIQTIRELSIQREQVKQTIYEITGIADIMRGASNAVETLGAQQLKAQWGSLRIQQMQQGFQRFVRGLLRLKGEIIASRFSQQTLSYIAGEPVGENILAFLRADIQRSYKIDIETDSTIRGDMARNQQNMTQFLNATASYLQTIAPAIQQGILPTDLALTLFSGFTRQFKLGKAIEDKLSEQVEQAEQQNAQQRNQPQKEQEKQAEMENQEAEARAINKQKLLLSLEKEKTEITKIQMEIERGKVEIEQRKIEIQEENLRNTPEKNLLNPQQSLLYDPKNL